MTTGTSPLGIGWVAGACRRRFDPRASITGKFVAAGLATLGVVFLVVATAVWATTTTVASTTAEADAVLRGGVLAFATVAVGVAVAFGVVERSVVRGLRSLDRDTRRAVETGRYDAGFPVGRSDEVGQLAWSVAELRDELATQVDTVEALNRDLARTATAQARTLDAVRDGDLTRRMAADTGVPQFDAVATRFNETVARTETMVGEVRAFSQAVARAARAADADATRAREGTDAVTAATVAISEGVERQHEELAATVEAVEDLVAHADDVASTAGTVARKSETARDATQGGAAAAGEAQDAISTIEDRTAASVAAIESLAATVDDVAGLADRVRALSAETEHLAMNAELEAKKAATDGSMTHLGRQIRDLAADTDAAAEAIEDALGSVAAETETAIAEVERTQDAVDRGSDTIEAALGAFADVEAVVAETAEDAVAIDRAADAQTRRASSVRETVATVDDIGARTAEQASDVAATARDQQAVIADIEERVDWLAEHAGDLEGALERFTTRRVDGPASVPVEGER
jgi:methyl-accepting chemotaxis protein